MLAAEKNNVAHPIRRTPLMMIVRVLKENLSNRDPQIARLNPLHRLPTLPMIVMAWSCSLPFI